MPATLNRCSPLAAPIETDAMSCAAPTRHIFRAALALAALATASAGAHAGSGTAVGGLAGLEVYDRTAGRLLPVHWHDGRHWIVGQPGHEYELRLRSRQPERLLSVTSVDGVNVISGETAAAGQGGYVLDGYGQVGIAGWRKSMERTAAFYFTALPDSYAARTGRPHDVGVIGVALFREAQPQPLQEQRIGGAAPTAPAADRARGSHRQAPAAAAESGAGNQSYAPTPQDRLGTGHGRSEWSAARRTHFRRASTHPDEVIELWYDSEANLIAQGVIAPPSWPPHRPRAFPAGFVPDP
jgi:hypothetical protein